MKDLHQIPGARLDRDAICPAEVRELLGDAFATLTEVRERRFEGGW